MHDIGLIIWLIIVAFGVISSIRKNIQRSRVQRAPAPAPMPRGAVRMQPAQPPPPPQPRPPSFARTELAMPPVDAPPLAPPAAVAVPLTPPLHRIGTSPIRGMFGGGTTLVRAIVAAEVLGPPKAFQEQTIWSPRHSEPSI